MFRPAPESVHPVTRWAERLQLFGITVLAIGLVAELISGGFDVVSGLVAVCLVLMVGSRLARRRSQPAAAPVEVDDALLHEIRALDAEGQRVAAVRRMRERTGLGLRDAVVAVDTLVRDPAATR